MLLRALLFLLPLANNAIDVLASSFRLEVERSSLENTGGCHAKPQFLVNNHASTQFLVNNEWTEPQILKKGNWKASEILKKDFKTPAFPTKVRLISNCKDASGYKKLTLIDDVGHEHVVLDSEHAAPYGDNESSIDMDEIKVAQRDYDVPPSAFRLQVETSTRSYAGGTHASTQFLVNNEWTEPQTLKDGGWYGGEILEKYFETPAWPTKVRLINTKTDAFGLKKITVIDNHSAAYVVLDSANGMPYSDNVFWLDVDEIKVPQRDYAIPGAPSYYIPPSAFRLKVETSTQKYAGGAHARTQFLVNNEWTEPQTLKNGDWYGGEVLEKYFDAPAWPTKVRLINMKTDAWGYKKITVIDNQGAEYMVLDSANGMPYGDNRFWIDVDQIKVPQRDYDIPGAPSEKRRIEL